jgi:Ni,Fe-hydrogenase maturation factor
MELHDLFDLASEAGLLTCPVTIIGVEPKDCRVGEGLSAELMSAVPSVIAEVERELGR